jgi:AraC-like DNA-binding protein
MAEIEIIEAASTNVVERYSQLSNIIAQSYSAPWCAEPLPHGDIPYRISFATADGATICRAKMPALRLYNRGSISSKWPSKYYAYSANQVSIMKLEGKPPLHLQPGELIIFSSETPCEYLMTHCYETLGLVISSDLFHQYVPNRSPILERPLNLPFGVNDVLRSTMETAWDISRAGLFGELGPNLVRSFLTMLTLVPLPDQAKGRCETTSLDIRRLQVKAFIDKHYAEADLSVESIAQRLQLSPRYVQKALAADGMTPGEYLRKRRLAVAARMLRDPSKERRSITQLSFDCGFNSSAHFSTEFRRVYGMSPREYRHAPIDT